MPLRVAFDLDGVLADMDAALVREAEVLFGEAMTRVLEQRADPAVTAPGGPQPPSTPVPPDGGNGPAREDTPRIQRLRMTSRQERKLWRHVESIPNFWESLDEIEPGAIARLAAIATDRRWEIIFLTKRPSTAGVTVQVQTQRWLEAKGFVLPSVFVVHGSRGHVASALGLDVVIDDRPENCLDIVVDSKARAILVWRFAASQLPATARRLGIGVLGSVRECLDLLVEVDSASRGDPGMMTRVMRKLGLKQTAGV